MKTLMKKFVTFIAEVLNAISEIIAEVGNVYKNVF